MLQRQSRRARARHSIANSSAQSSRRDQSWGAADRLFRASMAQRRRWPRRGRRGFESALITRIAAQLTTAYTRPPKAERRHSMQRLEHKRENREVSKLPVCAAHTLLAERRRGLIAAKNKQSMDVKSLTTGRIANSIVNQNAQLMYQCVPSSPPAALGKSAGRLEHSRSPPAHVEPALFAGMGAHQQLRVGGGTRSKYQSPTVRTHTITDQSAVSASQNGRTRDGREENGSTGSTALVPA